MYNLTVRPGLFLSCIFLLFTLITILIRPPNHPDTTLKRRGQVLLDAYNYGWSRDKQGSLSKEGI